MVKNIEQFKLCNQKYYNRLQKSVLIHFIENIITCDYIHDETHCIVNLNKKLTDNKIC